MIITLNMVSLSKTTLSTFFCKKCFFFIVSLLLMLLLVSSLLTSTFVSKAEGQANSTVAKDSINIVTVTIVTDSSTYMQGDIAAFKITSNTTPTGNLSVYDSSDTLCTMINIRTTSWYQTASGEYVYKHLAGTLVDPLISIQSDARTGTWRWNAIFNDEAEILTCTGVFTVNPRSVTQTPLPTLPPTIVPTLTAELTAGPTFDGSEDTGGTDLKESFIEKLVSSLVSNLIWCIIFFVIAFVCSLIGYKRWMNKKKY
jgi:hypothetical protein